VPILSHSPSFLADPSDPKSQIRVACAKCRGYNRKSWHKRMAPQPLDPNASSKRPTTAHLNPTTVPLISPPHIQSETRPEPSIRPLPPPESRPEAPLLIPPLPASPPRPPPTPPPPVQPAGFLPADQWTLIQTFYTALDVVKIEYCLRCRQRWFSMGIRHESQR
jgi:hypothetical protein